jgi:hypothetical protein
MTDINKFREQLLVPCGRAVVQTGERCRPGWRCNICIERGKAARIISQLQEEVASLRNAKQ